jgi:hypothetical protein
LDDVPEQVHIKQPTAEIFKRVPDCWFETIPVTLRGYLPEDLAKGVYKVATHL